MIASEEMKMLRVRLTDDLDVALERLRKHRHVNVSSWVRSVLRSALKDELHVGAKVPESVPETSPPPALLSSPIPGWQPQKRQGVWCSLWKGDTRALPADLVGQVIQIDTQTDGSFETTVVEVLERREDFVLVRDSGKPTPA